ncbi:APC family permease, partial [Mycoplasmopsis synoviae]
SNVWELYDDVFFAVEIFFQQISSKISGTVNIARSVAPMVEDKFLPVSLAKTNSKNEFKNAIWFSTAINIFSLVIFYVIPLILKANVYEEPYSY